MVMSTHGLPATSRTFPLNEPSIWAAARGANQKTSATASNKALNQDLFPRKLNVVDSRRDREALNFDSFMLESPFVAGRLLPEVPRAGMRPIISNLPRIPSATTSMCGYAASVRYGI